MIKISLNKELDYEVYADFWDFSVAGANFGQEIKNNHPNINIENYKKYIDDFYATHQEEMSNKLEEINEALNIKRGDFLLALKNLFGSDFNKNDYQGYLSIFNCNPRWPETKIFQIYYKKDLPHALEVVFHESLHFAFFDYCDKNLRDETKNLDKNSGRFWELSEIFNVIVLNLPEFRKILRIEEKLFYPKLRYKMNSINNFWLNKTSLDNFIKNSLTYLQNDQ